MSRGLSVPGHQRHTANDTNPLLLLSPPPFPPPPSKERSVKSVERGGARLYLQLPAFHPVRVSVRWNGSLVLAFVLVVSPSELVLRREAVTGRAAASHPRKNNYRGWAREREEERERLLDIAGLGFIRAGIVPIGSADKPRWDGA